MVVIGGSVILLMLLFPPWATRGGRDAGYGPIVGSSTRLRIDMTELAARPSFGDDVQLDISHLFVQSLIIALITSGVVFVMKKS